MWRKWVVIVDDDATVRGMFKEALERRGYGTITFGDADEALAFVRTVVPDLVILDLRMGRSSGGDFLDFLRGSESSVLRQMPVLIVSGFLGEEHGHDEGLNVVDRIEKPVALETLLVKVREAVGAETGQ